MKRTTVFTVIALCLLNCLAWPQTCSSFVASKSVEKTTIANIDFFGYGKVDVTKLRSILPIQPGESIEQSEWNTYRSKINEAIRSKTGKSPTDVELLCCDEHGNSMIYIGVAGTSNVAVQHKPAPTGESRLPAAALQLSRET